MFLNRHAQMMLGLGALAALASAQGEVAAATLEVTATVPDSCTVQGGTLAFGTIDPSGSDVSATGEVNINCNASSSVEVFLDGGLHNHQGGNGRAMKRASSDDWLNYRLFTENFTSWDDNVGIPTSLGAGANVVVVQGVVEGSQIVPGGEYSDTVEITLTFD